jgi:DNA-directed RNA polymerase subunit L
VRLRKYRHKPKDGLLEKSKVTQCSYEIDHKVSWDEDRILKIKIAADTENTRNLP